MAEGVAGHVRRLALPVGHQLDLHAGARRHSRDRPAKTGSSCARAAPAPSCRGVQCRRRSSGRDRRRAAWRAAAGIPRASMRRQPSAASFLAAKTSRKAASTPLPACMLLASMPSAASASCGAAPILATQQHLAVGDHAIDGGARVFLFVQRVFGDDARLDQAWAVMRRRHRRRSFGMAEMQVDALSLAGRHGDAQNG